jgi:hypothetical protein
MTQNRPVYPIHPGEVLADDWTEIGISPAELARNLHVPFTEMTGRDAHPPVRRLPSPEPRTDPRYR